MAGHHGEKGAGADHRAGDPADDAQGQVHRPGARGFLVQETAAARPGVWRCARVGTGQVFPACHGAELTVGPVVRRAAARSCPVVVVVVRVGTFMPPSECR
ncbi:hypothetical protein GCM10018781_79230 [Kitasatospora indigofera]|uniref:Uncharacterized protein n=1 Tax=Kitasatospora indigofera TaxID=67307 RepID=A0A918YW72_9ACTN|nr:hypothetical protein GCM10018781_79230 [Kitasatospora indigofera]